MIVVVWHSWLQDGSQGGVYAQRFAADGTPIGAEFRANTETADSQNNPDVSMAPDGRFVIVWISWEQDGDEAGVFGQLYNADGTPNGAEFQVNTATTSYQHYASVSMGADCKFIVAWRDSSIIGPYRIKAQRFSDTGAKLGSEFQVSLSGQYSGDPDVVVLDSG